MKLSSGGKLQLRNLMACRLTLPTKFSHNLLLLFLEVKLKLLFSSLVGTYACDCCVGTKICLHAFKQNYYGSLLFPNCVCTYVFLNLQHIIGAVLVAHNYSTIKCKLVCEKTRPILRMRHAFVLSCLKVNYSV